MTEQTDTMKKADPSKTKKLKHVRVYDKLYEQIKNGIYRPGDQLPPENTLSASMKVSRMTLRKALMLLQEDGLLKNVAGVGHFIRSDHPESPKTPHLSLQKEQSGCFSTVHPIYAYCTEPLENLKLDFRIEPPTQSILDTLEQYTAAVVIADRWYLHGDRVLAYSLSFIPIEVIGKLQIDLNDKDNLRHFLEQTCYEPPRRCFRSCSYSTAGNFTAKNYRLSEHDSFLLVFETVYGENEELLLASKHYIPAELFRIDLSI